MRLRMLLSFAAVLVLVCSVGGDAKPNKQFTRPCELSGDAIGEGEVGVKAWSYGRLEMTVLEGYIEPLDLEVLFTNAGLGTGDYQYFGRGRVLETQGRVDFYFDATDTGCRPNEWGETPGTDGTCRYCLILLNGVYDQNADKVSFTEATEALLYDTGVAIHDEGDTADLVVQFTDGDGGDETGPEKTAAACSDGKDNDGDGLIDCEDPNCKKVCR